MMSNLVSRKEKLWREMKDSRREFLTGLRMWPEERLMSPVLPEDRSVRRMVAAAAVAESRLLTAVQQIWNGDPVSVPLGADAVNRDRKEVERRMKWRWPEILDEIFWFREETNSTMTWLDDLDLDRSWESPFGVVTIEILLRSVIQRDRRYIGALGTMVLRNVRAIAGKRGMGTAWLVNCCR